MGVAIRLIGGGIAAFLLFSFILTLLQNSPIGGHLGGGPALSYVQTAELWLLVRLVLDRRQNSHRMFHRAKAARCTSLSGEIEQRVDDSFSRDDAREDRDNLGDRIEQKI